MSKWTGKSDFCDWCEMHNNPKEIVEKAKVYMGDARVAINNERDLIPYYTHLTASIATNPQGQSIHLSRHSWIDDEEKQFLSTKVIEAIQWARKAKKNKEKFDFNFCKKQKNYWGDNDAIWKAIIARINEKPEVMKFHIDKDFRKACWFFEEYVIPHFFYGIHDAMHTRYREQFVKYCSENGYCAFSINFETGEWGYQNQGEWHPVIRDMCFAIADFHKMEKDFK